jgi:FMN reductase
VLGPPRAQPLPEELLRAPVGARGIERTHVSLIRRVEDAVRASAQRGHRTRLAKVGAMSEGEVAGTATRGETQPDPHAATLPPRHGGAALRSPPTVSDPGVRLGPVADEGEPMIVGVGGSLRPSSRSMTALRIAAAAAEKMGAEVELFDVRLLDAPFYVPGAEPSPAVRSFAEAVHEADGLIWSSPMYHGTISGSFKNALDWLQLLARREPPFLTDKVVGLIGLAGGIQGLQAVNTMEFVVRSLRGFAVPLVIPISARDAFDGEGRLTHEGVRRQLGDLGREVAALCLRRTR